MDNTLLFGQIIHENVSYINLTSYFMFSIFFPYDSSIDYVYNIVIYTMMFVDGSLLLHEVNLR